MKDLFLIAIGALFAADAVSCWRGGVRRPWQRLGKHCVPGSPYEPGGVIKGPRP